MIQKYIPQKVHQNQRQLRFARWLQKKLIKEKIRMLQGKTVIWLSFFQTPLKNSLNYFLKRSQQMSSFCLLLPLHSPFRNSRVFTLGFVRYGISYEVYKQSMRKCYIWEKNRKQDEMAQLQFHDDISKRFFSFCHLMAVSAIIGDPQRKREKAASIVDSLWQRPLTRHF